MLILTHISLATLLSFWLGLPLLPMLLGSIIPDIDSPKTAIGKLFSPISYRLHRKFGHRTLTHSWIPLILLGIIYLITRDDSALSFLLGYISHILLDLLNVSGVMLLYPKRLYFTLTDAQIKTGKRFDLLLCFTFAIISWWLFLSS